MMNFTTCSSRHGRTPSVLPRPLSPTEVDQVAGGILPALVAITIGAVVAAAYERVCGDDSDSDDSSGDEQGN